MLLAEADRCKERGEHRKQQILTYCNSGIRIPVAGFALRNCKGAQCAPFDRLADRRPNH